MYYIVLDGTSGAICHYEVNVNSGIEQRSLLRLLSLIYPEMLKYVLVLPLIILFPFGFATEYTWTLPSGATVTNSGPSVSG